VSIPCGYDINSNDLIHGHADHWFEGEPGWIVTLIDVWAMQNPLLSEYNVAAWVPIDHFPTPPGVLDFFSRSQAIPIAMSRFGERSLFDQGLDPVYIPLSVDTSVFQPTEKLGELTCRQLIDVPDDAFVVGMVAMNKGWAKDRKGFNEAFWAFGQFVRSHPDAILYVHAEKLGGAEGQNLEALRIHAGIEDKNIRWADQYAYRAGYTPEMMAAVYTAFDVLLAPSHGEGFCVPLIEAQACGTPVIATDFSAQAELVGNGWPLMAQPEWDPAHQASYVCPLIDDVLAKLNEAYDKRDRLATMADDCIAFAANYDTLAVFVDYWLPFVASLEVPNDQLAADREPMPADERGRGAVPGQEAGRRTSTSSSNRSSTPASSPAPSWCSSTTPTTPTRSPR
jgi:glycosyltransferase involved in cell wall biosynthesis